MGSERIAVAAAALSSTLGGMDLGATRFVVAGIDPVTPGALRYGGGFLVLLPVTATAQYSGLGLWPQRPAPRGPGDYAAAVSAAPACMVAAKVW